jgi:hypothetical protein
MNSLRMIFSSLCVKLFKLISTEVKKVLNGPAPEKVCKPVAELQREPEQF